MGDKTVTFLRIERERPAGNGEEHADDEPMISFQHKDEIVEMSGSSYSKAFVGSTLKFIFKDEDERAELLERSRALSNANACSILDNVMDRIRNDAPEQSRRSVNLDTLFDSLTTARINTENVTPRNAAPRVVSGRERNDNAISTIMPDKSVPPVNAQVRIKNIKYPPPLPKTPPYSNQPAWKTLPTAPTVTVRQEDGRLEIAWNVKLTYKTEQIQSYELYCCEEMDAPADVPTWEKCRDIIAGKLPMSCDVKYLVGGHTYYFALRAVDVNGRRAPFATTKITMNV